MTPALRTPLVLLDVDGVINDTSALLALAFADDPETIKERLQIDVVESHGYRLAIPTYMPELIQALVGIAEVRWLTTWRERANDEIANYLGIPPLDVVDDGTRSNEKDWKTETARPIIEAALAEGRTVVWIEDFYADFPPWDDVVYVDTGEREVLRWSDLPVEALEG